jgi:hypothetical protein
MGHFLGLGHSALGETELRSGGGRTVLGKRAVMFPIAYQPGSVVDRTLQADDVAGITDVYGTPEAFQGLGAIQGRVTLNGTGVFGAHVTAFNPATGDLVSGFTLTDQGEFVIAALKPGQYIVRVEPLDDADLDGFFDTDTPVNVNFQVTYYSRQVAVPAGGAGNSIVIKVRSNDRAYADAGICGVLAAAARRRPDVGPARCRRTETRARADDWCDLRRPLVDGIRGRGAARIERSARRDALQHAEFDGCRFRAGGRPGLPRRPFVVV